MADDETGMDLVKGTKTRLQILEETPVGEHGIAPTNYAQIKIWAEDVVASGLAPYGVKTASQVIIATQRGMELGFTMSQSLDAIAVINNKPTIVGEAAEALVRSKPFCDYLRHGWRPATEAETLAGEGPIIGWCISRRAGGAEERNEFTWGDAVVAGLDKPMKWKNNKSLPNPDSPWIKYPKRMVGWRAAGFHMKDFWSDVTHGLTISEEARDLRPPERDVTPVAADEPPAQPDPLFAPAPAQGILDVVDVVDGEIVAERGQEIAESGAPAKASEELDDRRGFDGPTDAVVTEEGAGDSAPPVSSGEVDPDTGEVIPDNVGD